MWVWASAERQYSLCSYYCVTMLIVLTYSWNSVLLEKLTGALLIKKFPAFYGTKRIITLSVTACHMSIS